MNVSKLKARQPNSKYSSLEKTYDENSTTNQMKYINILMRRIL